MKKILGILSLVVSILILYPLYVSFGNGFGYQGPFWSGVFVFGTIFILFLLLGIYLIKSSRKRK
jgi:hypothetical protein